MAKLVCNFISYALKRTVDITVVLPSVTIPEAMQLPMPGKENPVPPTHEVKEKYPVLYLLHGMGKQPRTVDRLYECGTVCRREKHGSCNDFGGKQILS